MANPQKENGYTMIANELLEGLAKTRISGESYQILCFIIRKTYGFNKKIDTISLSQFCIATGLPKSTVCRAIRYLKMRNMIKTYPRGYATDYEINKDYETWDQAKLYDREKIFKRDGYMCHICHSVKDVKDLEVDHVVPLWLNGSNKEENLAACCKTCNRKKGALRLRNKTDTVTELPQLHIEEKGGDKIVNKPVTRMGHTKETTKEIIQKKGDFSEKIQTPKDRTKEFFKGVEDMQKKIEDKEFPETTEMEKLKKFLTGLMLKYPDVDKKSLWDEILKFQRYWTELNHTGNKERWQQQATFMVERRLVTWLGNKNSFKNVAKDYKVENF